MEKSETRAVKKKRERKGGWIKRALLLIALLVVAGVAVLTAKVMSLDAWHEFDPERILASKQTLIVYDSEGEEYTRLHNIEDRVWIKLEEVPLLAQKAFISAEDARYYEHSGIDIIRIFGAAWEDIKAGAYVQGASTITQQLVKLSHLTSEKTISRKLEEAVLAYQMERDFSKEEILEMYLNFVYFGRGYYGIEAASWGYFGKHADALTVSEAAALAGILKSPSKYAPHINIEACTARRNNILGLMRDYGYIDEAACEQERAYTLEVKPLKDEARGYYVDAAIKEAANRLGVTASDIIEGGYRLYTYMDSGLQEKCEAVIANDAYFPEEEDTADDDAGAWANDACEGALCAVRTGDGTVAATVGGRGDAEAMSFDRASDIRRQPGSVIKPILVYAPALEYASYTAATVLLDEKVNFGDYRPSNFADKYYGWVTMREAVTRSLNIPAVKVLEDVGIERAKSFAETLGIDFTEEDTSLALALGGFTYGVSPLQIASAYSAFASGGEYREPAYVEKITDSGGNVLYARESAASRVMSEQNAYILTSMLKSAIKSGTGRRLGELGLPIAGKTGTVGESEGNRDAWMAAYTSEYSLCMWIGYDTSRKGELPSEITGGTYPALALKEVFEYVYSSREAKDFAVPAGVIEIKLDKRTLEREHTALIANSFTPSSDIATEYFVSGTEPRETTRYWTVPAPARDFSVALSENNLPLISFRITEKKAIYRLYRGTDVLSAVELKDFRGVEGAAVAYEDTEAVSGAYSYFVVSEHEAMKINGLPARGPSSAVRTVYVIPLTEDGGEDGEGAPIPDGDITIELEDTEMEEE